MTTQDERMQILKMIEDGTISPSQGLELLKALGQDEPEEAEPESLAWEAPDAGLGQHELIQTTPPQDAFITPVPPLLTSDPVELDGPLPAAAPLFPEPASPVEPVSLVEPVPSVEPILPVSSTWGGETGAGELPEQAAPQQPVTGEVLPEVPPAPDFRKWQRWWQIPLAIGVVITVLGGLWMYLAYLSSGLGFWFACAWFPFLFGVGVLALAWASRSMRWLHLRVHQKPGERPQTIAISMPLPIHLAVWFVRTFGVRISSLKGQNLDQMLMMLEHTSPDEPLYIKVDDDDGEQVEIFIG